MGRSNRKRTREGDFDLAMVAHSMQAGEIAVEGDETKAIAVDFHGLADGSAREVVCRVVLHPDAVTEVIDRLAATRGRR
jgi:hypothetical protein